MDSASTSLDIELYDAVQYKEDDQIQTKTYPNVNVLEEESIRKRMEDEIQRVSDVFLLSKAEAMLLLSYHDWNVDNIEMEWLGDHERIREMVGILMEKPVDESCDDIEFYCGGCDKSYPCDNFAAVSCGHRLCTQCWTRHINKIINENVAVEWHLKLKCPYESCQVAVDQDMVNKFASSEEKLKFNQHLLKSYLHNKKIKWCPAADCNLAIEYLDHHSENLAVTCRCSHSFCWTCTEEIHSPMDCKTAANWLSLLKKNNDPNWNRKYYKDARTKRTKQGENSESDSYLFDLESFSWPEESDSDDDDDDDDDDDQLTYKYKLCYKNWSYNEKMMQKAKEKLQKLRSYELEDLSCRQLPTVPQLEFILKAWLQIMECRRFLKWIHAYCYFRPDDEVQKLDFLKHMQEDAEIPLNKLFQCAENELQEFLETQGLQNFDAFRNKLTKLTSVTRDYYEKLGRDIKEGLANVDSTSTKSTTDAD